MNESETPTPRVDEMVRRLHGSDSQPFLDFAHQLERELAAMTKERDELLAKIEKGKK